MLGDTRRSKVARLATIVFASVLLLAGGLGLRASDASPSNPDAELKIQKLPVCYALGIDAIGRGDVPAGIDTWDDCFTDDVTFAIYFAGSDFNGPPDYTSVGVVSWADFANSFFRNAGYTSTQHLVGTVNVELQGNKAKITSYIQASHFVGDGSVDIAKGTYEDDVVLDHGRWKIKRRTLKLLSSLNFVGTPSP
jgi:hypothetical protein